MKMLGSMKQNIGNRSVCELYRTLGLRPSQLPFLGVLRLILKVRQDSLTKLFFVDPTTNCSKLDFHFKEGPEVEFVEVKTNKYLSDLADLTRKRQCLIQPYRD